MSRELAVCDVRRKNGEPFLRVDEERKAAHMQDIVVNSQVAGKCDSSRCLIERLRRILPCEQQHAAQSRAIAEHGCHPVRLSLDPRETWAQPGPSTIPGKSVLPCHPLPT